MPDPRRRLRECALLAAVVGIIIGLTLALLLPAMAIALLLWGG
jgi:hypothetical protein